MFKKLALSLVMVLFLALPVMAENVYISIGGSHVIENIDTKTHLIDLDNTQGLNLRAGKILNDNLAIEITYDYLSPFTWSGYGLTANLDIQTLILAGKLTAGDKLKPYLTAGMGLMHGELNISYLSDSETDLCGKAGIGIDCMITDKVSLGLETAYIIGLNDLDQVRYIQTTCGIAYHF